MQKGETNEIKEAIMNYVNSKKFTPCSKEELVEHFSSYYEVKDVQDAVVELLTNYDLLMTNRKHIQSASSSGIFKGNVTGVNDDYFYVHVDGFDDDFRVSRKGHELLFPKSVVVIKAYDFNGRNGEVVKVLENRQPNLVGEIVAGNMNKRGQCDYYIVPKSKRIGYKLKVDPNEVKGLVDGSVVRYKLEVYQNKVIPHIEKILGHKTDPGVDILEVVEDAEAPYEFSSDSLTQAANLPKTVSDEEKAQVEDHTKYKTITIDPSGCQDADDAISMEKIGDGKLEDSPIRCRVYIADVSHYVTPGSPIDKDAALRGTSIYTGDRVIPMLPRELCNGICSLNAGEDRLAIAYEFTVNPDGSISDPDLKEVLINVDKAIDYDKVTKIIEEDPAELKENAEYVDLINLGRVVNDRRSKLLRKNGKLDLDTKEMKMDFDENGHPTNISLREQREAEKIIENLMIATNEVFAKYVFDMGLHILFRNHDFPDIEKLDRDFIPYCQSLKIKPRFQNDNFAYEYYRIIDQVDDPIVKAKLSELFVRCLPKAVYGADEIGHFGLALNYYAQLTAPIRRYPDLINQRILVKLMHLKEHPEYYEEIQDYYDELIALGESTSSQERRADQIERDVDKMKAAEYMADHLNEEHKAIVSGFTKKGMFAQLNNGVEGFIPFRSINADNFGYDDHRKVAVGKRSGELFNLGTPILINVKRASKADSQIDFAYVRRLDKGKNSSKDDTKKKRRN